VPRVAVGMPVYNSQKHLAAAIESILGQTFCDLELIICDNASTDDSPAICERYAAADRRVRFLRNPVNLGGNPNYRRVASEARSEYFKWASSNDLLDPDFIERCVRRLDERPDAVLAFGQTVIFHEDPRAGTPYDDRQHLDDPDPFIRFRRCADSMRLNNVLNGLIRASALRRTSMLRDYLSSDNVLIAELALAGRILAVPETRFYRRMDPESSTQLQSAADVRRHHYPTDRLGSFFQSFQLALGYLSAVLSAQRLPLGARMRALAYVARQTYWLLPGMAADVREAYHFYVRRARG
jgi:glycosyltransferase involved in cell wall biosynthesis